jgi:hypothetical protein
MAQSASVLKREKYFICMSGFLRWETARIFANKTIGTIISQHSSRQMELTTLEKDIEGSRMI